MGVALVTGTGPKAHAEDATVDKGEQNQRCAVRLSVAIAGKSPDASLMTSDNPQGAIDGLVGSPDFAERFSRFVNAQFNGGPQVDATNDPVYYLAKYVITNDKPWSELFVGGYSVTASDTAMDVAADPDGLGYFRSDSWRKRYAGNEDAGYMLSASFRILSNVTGLELIPSVGNPGDDRTAEGRHGGVCKSCHFESWFALDTIARLLPKRKGQGDTMTFTKPTEGPQQLLGKTLNDDKDLVTSLVDSDAYRFAQCRMVFKYLYGRSENQCEAPVFDQCVDALSNQKTIKAAVAAVAKDPGFCAN